MLKAIQNILVALVGSVLCWIPVIVATFDWGRQDCGTFIQCQRRAWSSWWEAYDDIRA
jgi:hypothetical protein